MLERQERYKHDFYGSCAPGKMQHYSSSTFSVGIFQWLPKASGNGLKRSAVVYRIKGYTSDPNEVYRRANDICDMLDAGWEPKKKSETVK